MLADLIIAELQDPALGQFRRRAGAQQYLIRACDILLAIAGLILCAPFFLIIPVLIKLDSPGRAFFLQRRLGHYGEPFTMVKFRTMVDRDNQGWTVSQDPRITFIGKILRKYHLDEIPQLLNVLQGDMSIVGPRPYTPAAYEKLCRVEPCFARRLLVKPGLTGFVQLVGRVRENNLRDHLELLQYDLRYLDIPVTLKTYMKMIFGTFAYLIFETRLNTF
jgi:lipopolysaccharide/colanic/teichoic acid biosynthesis glycosyltransferase